MVTQLREEQFSNYKLWVNILEKLYNGISLSRNDTFTGKQAADHLDKILPTVVTHKECTRDMAVNLLKLFARDGYFTAFNNKDDKSFFDDASRYKFNNTKVEQYIEDSGFSTGIKMCRSQSLRYTSHSSNHFAVHNKTQNADLIMHSEMPSPSTRLSLSCNDLCTFPKDVEKASTSSHIIRSTKRNIKNLCGNVLKSSENVKNSSLLSRGVSPLISRISTRNSARNNDYKLSKNISGNSNSSKANDTSSAMTEADEFKLWAHCLIDRFKQASGGLTFTHEFSGVDIRWNCKMVSARGIVAKLPEKLEKFEQNVEFPVTLIDDMRRLANWSASTVRQSPRVKKSTSPSRSAISTASASTAKFDNMADNNGRHMPPFHMPSPISTRRSFQNEPAWMFSRIAITLVKGKFVPLIPEKIADNLVTIFNEMTKVGDTTTNSRSFGVMRNMAVSSNNEKGRAQIATSTEASATRLASARQHHMHPKNRSIEEPIVLSASPIRTRLQRKKMSLNEPLMKDMPTQKQQKFLACLQLCLLTLEPPTRRKIQIFVLYLERILKNVEIRLHEEKDSRTYILERLSALFIEPKGKITDVVSANFLALFLDYSQQLFFKTPQWLESDVRQKIDNILSGKEILTREGLTMRRSCDHVYGNQRQSRIRVSKTPPAEMTHAYCERIDSDTFEAQKHQHNKEMLSLLDSIIANENMNPTKKADTLKQFCVTYPEVYKIRFPQYNCTEVNETPKGNRVNDGNQGLIARIRRIMIA